MVITNLKSGCIMRIQNDLIRHLWRAKLKRVTITLGENHTDHGAIFIFQEQRAGAYGPGGAMGESEGGPSVASATALLPPVPAVQAALMHRIAASSAATRRQTVASVSSRRIRSSRLMVWAPR